jgi:hypothetical protein
VGVGEKGGVEKRKVGTRGNKPCFSAKVMAWVSHVVKDHTPP